jgi:hypothetical protein
MALPPSKTWSCRGISISTILIAVISVLVSCAPLQGFPEDPEDTANTLAGLQVYFTSDMIRDYEASTGETRLQLRNTIVLSRMRAYDITFSNFRRRLAGDGNIITTGGDLAILILGGLIATTGGATTKAALGAATAGIAGAQGVINKDLYFQRTLPALLAQMDANRAQAKLPIVSGLQHSDAEYPLQQALVDLDGLRDSGSVPSAIGGITQTAEQSKADAQKQLVIPRNAAFLATRDDRQAIKEQIDKLQSQQLLALARIMVPRLASRSPILQANLARLGPEQSWLTSPSRAAIFLEAWIGFEDPSPANLMQWREALAQMQQIPSGAPSGSQRRTGPTPLHVLPDKHAITRQIIGLTDQQVLTLVKIMQPQVETRSAELKTKIKQLRLDLTKPAMAREYLEAWSDNDDVAASNTKQWSDAIKEVLLTSK